MTRLSEILLHNLQLRHLFCLLHRVEDRRIGLARLKIEGPVFRLQNHIVAELAVEVLKFRYRLFYTVFALMGSTIDE